MSFHKTIKNVEKDVKSSFICGRVLNFSVYFAGSVPFITLLESMKTIIFECKNLMENPTNSLVFT